MKEISKNTENDSVHVNEKDILTINSDKILKLIGSLL